MKRFFILASAAIVALASCAKTEVVYKNAPEQIAFKHVTGVMTKGEPVLLDGTLGVFANRTAAEKADGAVYFENTLFTASTGIWTGGVYWPYEGNLNFTVYAPRNDESEYASNVLTIKNVAAGEALYYGVARYLDTQKADYVPVFLNHASAKILVNLTSAATYTVTSLKLTSANKTGNVVVTYANPVTVATTDSTPEEVEFNLADTDNETAGVNMAAVYVLPGEQSLFEISFTQENGVNPVSFTKTIDLDGDWVANTAYTYNISIAGPELIKFEAKTYDWTPAGEQNFTEADFE